MSDRRVIEVRGFKWPRRSTGTSVARLLGEDAFGRWLGIAQGDPWWTGDRSRPEAHQTSFVKLVPDGTFWTARFHAVDPLVDVDIVLPVHWTDDVLEEVDLELDVLRLADGGVRVRDQDTSAQVRQVWPMPEELVTQAEATCAQLQVLVAQHVEPFGEVGLAWLARFLTEADATRPELEGNVAPSAGTGR